MSGGTGAGLGSKILEWLSTDYHGKTRAVTAVFPTMDEMTESYVDSMIIAVSFRFE